MRLLLFVQRKCKQLVLFIATVLSFLLIYRVSRLPSVTVEPLVTTTPGPLPTPTSLSSSTLTLTPNSNLQNQTTSYVTPVRYMIGKVPMNLARFGNEMFVYASLLGISRQNLMVPLYDGDVLRSAFQITVRKPSDVNPSMEDMASVGERSALSYDSSLETLSKKHQGHVTVYGYLQSWKYFREIGPEIRREFTFRSEHGNLASSFLRVIASKYRENHPANRDEPVYIGVHIRRGDMVDDQFQKGYTVADDSYLEAAMRYMKERFPEKHLIYVVCSDDIIWSKRHFRGAIARASMSRTTPKQPRTGSNNTIVHANVSRLNDDVNFDSKGASDFNVDNTVVFSENRTQEQDLAILAACNHTIMTVGTYGWWAGYLVGGITIYYKNFPLENSELSEIFSREDFFPLDWVAL